MGMKPIDQVTSERVEKLKTEWCLLAFNQHGHPTYACPKCFRLHLTLVTPGVRLPPNCRVCGYEPKQPDGGKPGPTDV